MKEYIIYGLVGLAVGYLFWNNRKDLNASMKHGDGGFSTRKIIALQFMFPLFLGDLVYIYKLWIGSAWAEKNFLEWKHTNSLYIMFVLGFLSFPEIIRLINTIRGNPIKEESTSTVTKESSSTVTTKKEGD